MTEQPTVQPVSIGAVNRVVALQQQVLNAANTVLKQDGYSDFFVESPGGGSWHEAFTDVIGGGRAPVAFTPGRLASLDAVHVTADGYSDFFVENGGSWHEAFTDVVGGDPTDRNQLLTNPAARARAVGTLQVVQAYARLKAATPARP
jgi:hypothetical protein